MKRLGLIYIARQESTVRVLVACEFSGIVRDAFRARGHDAISCDLLPSERPGPHIRGDVLPLLEQQWDLVIAHPPCTYLANSGVRWLHTEAGRWNLMRAAAAFFMQFLASEHERVAVENPVVHGHAGLPGAAFTVQPWQFGHGESKRICFWTKGLPRLQPTEIVSGCEARVHRMSPGPDRAKERSRFFPKIAAAMADQWGTV